MIKLEMKNCNTILTEKQQKYSHYPFANFDKYKYLTSEGILPSNQDK